MWSHAMHTITSETGRHAMPLFHGARNGQMLNFIGVNFEACTLGQKDQKFSYIMVMGSYIMWLLLCHAAISSVMRAEYQMLRT